MNNELPYAGDELAFPFSQAPMGHFGLTKRELFAALMMQGLISSLAGGSVAEDGNHVDGSYSSLACRAVLLAEALVAELYPASDEKDRGDSDDMPL